MICSPPAIERLSSGLFQEVIITNTVPVSEKNYFPQLTVLSVANLLGESIWRVHDDYSVRPSFYLFFTFFFLAYNPKKHLNCLLFDLKFKTDTESKHFFFKKENNLTKFGSITKY